MKEDIITVIGSINYDIIFKQNKLPTIGETITAESVSFSGGGKGANQAVQCAKLGARTYLVGSVGNDSFGEILTSQLKGYGVNIEHTVISQDNTGIGVVNSLGDGTLIATISTGANFRVDKNQIDSIDYLLQKSRIVIFQMEIPTEIIEYAVGKAHEAGCYIILNAAPAKEISGEALSKVNCLIVNEPEASFYCGEDVRDVDSAKKNCSKLYSRVKDLVIITLGERGSVLYDGREVLHIKPQKVKAVESTGAGDSYIGAFAYKILSGCQYVEAAEFAAKAGAYTVMGLGAQESMPTFNQLLGF